MTALSDRVWHFLRQHDLARRETRVIIALSGGSDSIALAHILRELDVTGELRVVGLAHFNHQLRAVAADEEGFCQRVAAWFGWPILTGREDVAARARHERRSLELTARTARHAFFERARLHFDADVVALGHTRDDQAETFLLRLIRGAGLRGLAAMHPRSGSIVRPLLACRRRDLRAYLDERRIAYVEDESNADVAIPRNRVRAELLPLLAERFNPQIVEVLAKEAEIARGELEWMEAAADELAWRVAHPSTLSGQARVWEFDVAGLNASPPALRRFLLWRAMTGVAAGRPVSFNHVEAVLQLMDTAERRAIDVPGQRVERVGSRLVVRGRAHGAVGRPAPALERLFHYSLSIPGEVLLPDADCVVSAEELPSGAASLALGGTTCNGATAVVRRDLCRGGWAIRNRRPGDRFRPAGLGGQKKLQDFFIDRKVARGRRDAVPLVVDDTDRIVWVAGHGIDQAFRVTDPAQAVIILRLKLLGGSV